MVLSPSMATFSLAFFILATFLSSFVISQPPLDSAEQESLYRVLHSINSAISWRSLFPDDLCLSPPHGVVCDYFSDPTASHISELSFGYVSDYSPNPPCTPDSTINPLLLSSFSHLRKLFFFKCFTQTTVSLPDLSALNNKSVFEELVFVENPSLVGSLISGSIGNLTSLKRLILSGTNVCGNIPDGLGDLVYLEQLSLSRNKFSGVVSVNFGKLERLKILEISENELEGSLPESIGGLTELLKLDLSFNNFSGKIPEKFKGLKKLEFMDLGYNKFGNNGLPWFLGEMPSLKELHLSGNLLGGQIPEIWENMGGILGIGFSNMGLVGTIPSSMGMFLRKVSYLGLDNNKLEGTVPEEFGTLECVNELSLENNNLSGRVPFSAKFKGKLKLEGNSELCADELLLTSAGTGSSLGQLKLCKKPVIPQSVLLDGCSPVPLFDSHVLMILMLIVFLFL